MQPSANGGAESSPAAVEPAEHAAAGMDPEQLWDALQRGIRWPTPAESPPFWERPARDAPLLLGDAPYLFCLQSANFAGCSNMTRTHSTPLLALAPGHCVQNIADAESAGPVNTDTSAQALFPRARK